MPTRDEDGESYDQSTQVGCHLTALCPVMVRSWCRGGRVCSPLDTGPRPASMSSGPGRPAVDGQRLDGRRGPGDSPAPRRRPAWLRTRGGQPRPLRRPARPAAEPSGGRRRCAPSDWRSMARMSGLAHCRGGAPCRAWPPPRHQASSRAGARRAPDVMPGPKGAADPMARYSAAAIGLPSAERARRRGPAERADARGSGRCTAVATAEPSRAPVPARDPQRPGQGRAARRARSRRAPPATRDGPGGDRRA
jgi:hypothetical protein